MPVWLVSLPAKIASMTALTITINFVSFFVVIVLTFVHCVPDWKCVILWSGILYWLYVLKFAMTVPLNVPNMPLIRPAAKLVKRLAKNAKKHAKK
jgi:hypothetical protein